MAYFQDLVGNANFAKISPAGVIEGDPAQYVAPGTVFEHLAKTAIVGDVGRKALVYTEQVPVGGLVLFEFPTAAAPTRTLRRTVSTASHLVFGVGIPDVLFQDQEIDIGYLVTNTSGAAISIYIADQVSTRTPIRFHADHSAARPTIPAGATYAVEILYRPSGAILRVGPPPASSGRKEQPTHIASYNQGAAANVTIPNLAVGDLVLAHDMRINSATEPTLRTGFTSLATFTIPTTIMAGRLSYKFIGAGETGAAIPFPPSNPISRAILQHWRGVALAGGIVGAAAAAGSTNPGTIPACVATEPCVVVLGIAGRRYIDTAWGLPANFEPAGLDAGAVEGTVMVGGKSQTRFGTPADTFVSYGSSLPYWGSFVCGLIGKAI